MTCWMPQVLAAGRPSQQWLCVEGRDCCAVLSHRLAPVTTRGVRTIIPAASAFELF